MMNLGDFDTTETIFVPLTTYDSDGASVTITGLAVTDIEIYKDGVATTRASDNGYALLDTDGIDFDSITGLHAFSIDLSDNSDDGFYVAGSQYFLVVSAITVDSQTVTAGYYFTIGRTLRPTTAGRTLDVNATGEAGLDLDNTSGTIAAAQIATDAITAAKIAANSIGASELATDAVDEIADGVWDEVLTGNHETEDTGGRVLLDTRVRGDVAQAGGASTITLAAGADATDNTYRNNVIAITNGTGGGQVRIITAYDGTSKVATVDRPWITNPDNTSQYSIQSMTAFTQDQIRDAILADSTPFNGDDIAAILANQGTPSSNGLAGDLADLPSLVWDEVLTGGTHNIADSAGRRLRDLQEFGVYEGGAIWIDTVNGSAGTTDFESGTAFNPVDTLEDANTLAASLGLSRFRVAPGSSIVFGSAGPQSNQEFFGTGWTLDLGGQDIAGTTIQGATVSGIGTGSGARFISCTMGDCTLADCTLIHCGLAGTITASAAGDYFLDGCYSEIAGAATPTFDIGAGVANTNLSFRHYSGGIEIENMNETGADTMSLEGFGQLILNANCAGGTIAIRGNFTVTDNAGGAVTLSDDARIDVDQVTDAILSDAVQFDGADIAAILEDTGTTLPATLGTPSSNGLSGDIDDLKGATFDPSTDSLEAIRNRGDAEWVTGAGGAPPDLLQSTTIATLATQVSFTLTAGSADDNAYDDALIVITDASTSTQKAVGIISAYTGGSKTVTLLADPGIFTMAAGDTVNIIAFKGALASVCTEARLAELDAGNLPSDIDDILEDTGTTLPATLGTPSSNGLAGDLGDVQDDTAAILGDTNEMQGKLPTNNIMGSSDKSDKDDEIDAILVDTGTTIPSLLGTPSSNGLAGDLGDVQADIAAVPTAVENRQEMDSNSTELAAILSNLGTPSSNGIAGDIGDLNTLIAALNDLSAADVNAEVVDALFTDTISELAQGVPATTPTIATAIMLLYMALRNKIDIDASNKDVHNNAGTRIATKALTDDATTYSEATMITGA